MYEKLDCFICTKPLTTKLECVFSNKIWYNYTTHLKYYTE